jgi:hypothetical protein
MRTAIERTVDIKLWKPDGPTRSRERISLFEITREEV